MRALIAGVAVAAAGVAGLLLSEAPATLRAPRSPLAALRAANAKLPRPVPASAVRRGEAASVPGGPSPALAALDLLRRGQLGEAERVVNAAQPADVRTSLDAATTARIEAELDRLPPRGREIGAWLIGKSPEADASELLARHLRRESDTSVRLTIVAALGCRNDATAVGALETAAAQDPVDPVRASASLALTGAARNDPAARAFLIGRLAAEGSGPVAVAVATAVGRVPSDASASALLASLDSPSQAVRLAAARGLENQAGHVTPGTVAAQVAAQQDLAVQVALTESQKSLAGQLDVSLMNGCTVPSRR